MLLSLFKRLALSQFESKTVKENMARMHSNMERFEIIESGFGSFERRIHTLRRKGKRFDIRSHVVDVEY
jgi:hypothetical protein